MANIERRLMALERRADGLESCFAGMVTLYPGQNPLDALDGRGPGLWFLVDDDLNGPGLMGRVSRDGKRTIIYGGHHATA